ncbi:PadR family transcriptional regulator [Cellulomonas sp. NPDC089187]|uniref:PadR family transcriptional regulator n=1 Tax=Cellulomonas sp. NPDC089187 TaxID=3154970 RepID=UPI00341D318C
MPPVFAHGQLRLYLLAMLAEGPLHGYQVITALSERFGGTYRPSPGTVYPRLARLEEEGLVRRTELGRRAQYELTDTGRAELAAHAEELAALERELTETVRTLASQVRAEVTSAMAGVRAELAAAAAQARTAARGRSQDDAEAAAEQRRQQKQRRIECEAELTRFREQMRGMLRTAEAQGRLGQLGADTLRTMLNGATTAVEAALGR